MKNKLALAGLAIAGLAAFPVLSLAQSHGHNFQHGNQHSHTVGTPIYCDDEGDDDFFQDGGFARWTNDAHGHSFFQFGQTTDDGTDDVVGMRVETSAPARTLQADINIGNWEDPELFVTFNDGGFTDFHFFDLSSSNSAITQTNLGHGITRVFYNANTDGIAGDTLTGVYWVDEDVDNTDLRTMQNVLVNGAAVTPNFVGIQLDCTLDFHE